MRYKSKSMCAHRVFKVSYSPKTGRYTSSSDRLTDSIVLTTATPYETVPGVQELTYSVDEKWGVKAVGSLSDASASYPEFIIKWTWKEAPDGPIVLVLEQQIQTGTQADPDQVKVSYHAEDGTELTPRIARTTWRHLDDQQLHIGVLVFAVVDPVPEKTDAGVFLRALDATTYKGYRTTHWSSGVRVERVEMDSMDHEKVSQMFRRMEALEDYQWEIGLDALKSEWNGSSGYLNEEPSLAQVEEVFLL